MSAPLPTQAIENPQTIGEHLRNRRLKLKLFQSQVAELLAVCEDSLTGWENERNEPLIYHYPKIIQFLGYNPFHIEIDTLGGRIKNYRIENGLSQEELGKLLNVNESTVFHWEKNTHIPLSKKRQMLDRLIEKKSFQ